MADFSTTPPEHGDVMSIAGAGGDSFRVAAKHYAAIEVTNLGANEMTVTWAYGALPSLPVVDAANNVPVRAGESVPFDITGGSNSSELFLKVIGTTGDRMAWRGRGSR